MIFLGDSPIAYCVSKKRNVSGTRYGAVHNLVGWTIYNSVLSDYFQTVFTFHILPFHFWTFAAAQLTESDFKRREGNCK